MRSLKSIASRGELSEELPSTSQIAALLDRWESEDVKFLADLEAGARPDAAMGTLGVRLFAQRRFEDSLQVLSAAVAVSPEDLSLVNNWAVALQQTGRVKTAIAAVEYSLTIKKEQMDSWIFLAGMRETSGDLTAAGVAYETALSLHRDHPLAWQGLGLIRQKQRRFAEAIECLLQCVHLNHAPAPLLAVLGQLYYTTGQFEKSKNAYTAAVELDHANAMYRKMLDETRFICGLIEGSGVDSLLVETAIEDRDALLHKTSLLLSSFGHLQTAIAVAQKRTELFPSPTADYIASAIRGDVDVPRSPDNFLVESFNAAAERFDDHLVNTLGYTIPQQLAKLLHDALPAGTQIDILDAGCGTGLCGPHLRELARTLTCVDLAEKMLAKAAARGVYDRLICKEMTAFLLDSPSQFDAIVAADVFIYFGNLSSLVAAIAVALRPGGVAAFSIERTTEANHQLLTSGRFAQSVDYVRSIFAAEFVEVILQETTVRLEANQPVRGNLFLFRRR